MFKKLVKHEILATYRSYVPVYLAIIIFSVITPITRGIKLNQVVSLLMSVLGLLMAALVFLTLYNIIISVGKRVYGKPGYLLFATPVSAFEIILSKVLVNLMWTIASFIVSILAFSGFMLSVSSSGFKAFYEGIGQMITWNNAFDIFSIVSLAIFYVVYMILLIMLTFAVTNALYKGEHKIIVGFVVYFVISQITGIITSIVTVGPLFLVIGSSATNFDSFIWYLLLIYFLLSVAFFYFVYVMVEKKLELQ